METQLHPKKRGPQFLAHVCCGKMAGLTKVPLGMEVGLGAVNIVLDGDPAPPSKKGHSPHFSSDVYCAQTAGWIKMPLGTEVGLSSGLIVLGGDPAPPPKKGHSSPNFRLMSIVAKRLPISAIAEHLFIFELQSNLSKSRFGICSPVAALEV